MDTTPQIKFESSPANSLADSFDSTPGNSYPPLFNDMNTSEAMTPQSYDDDSMFGSVNGSVAGTPAPEKKPAKKRKSWGQQLPEPKTNLPPRKRAKTEDEKEQRRVERVLRNRRAAQSSRERKRQEVEALEAEKHAVERQNQDLQMRLADAEARNAALQAELERIGGSTMKVFRGSVAASPVSQSQIEQLRQPTPITFSKELFGSSNEEGRPISNISLAEPQPQTVNPASLSPEIRAIDQSTNAISSDMTQHPAAMLCDLQCQSEERRPWTDSMISQLLAMTFLIKLASGAISSILSPLSQIINSIQTGSPLSSTNSILTMIIWMVTTTASLTNSHLTTSSTTTNNLRPKFSLRISLLRRLLACSPNLARPLMDATMVAMRSASEQQLPVCLSFAGAACRGSMDSPSVESLMTLLWAIHVIEGERERAVEAPELDAASEVKRVCIGLEDVFRQREVAGNGVVSFVTSHSGLSDDSRFADWPRESQKSLEGWRTAFNKQG